MQLLEGVDLGSQSELRKRCHDVLSPQEFAYLEQLTTAEAERIDHRTAWNISATLREFPTFPDFTIWFDYPVHLVDTDRITENAISDGKRKKKSESKGPAWGSEEARNNGTESMVQRKEEEKKKNKDDFEKAIESVGNKVDDIITYYSGVLSPDAIKARARRYGYSIVNGRFIEKRTLENLTPPQDV
jgi:hypothetical protein